MLRVSSLTVALLLALSLAAAPAQAQTFVTYVDNDATGANDGTSWTDAYTDLQTAINNASSISEIWVAEGIYKPDSEGDSFAITGRRDGLEVYGGFEGNESTRSARDPQANKTILSGDLNGDDTDPDGDGVIEDADPNQDGTPENLNGRENAHHVVVLDGGTGLGADVSDNITSATVLDGVVVTAGHADGSGDDENGGGLYCDGRGSDNACSPTLRNVVFAGNAAGRGGALYNNGEEGGTSSPPVTNTTITGNAAGLGGAIYNNGFVGGIASPQITNATITDNAAKSGGGAIYNDGFDGTASPRIANTILFWNTADADVRGDEIFNDETANDPPLLTHTIIEGGVNGRGVSGGLNALGGGNLMEEPQFADASTPDGPDGVFATRDDGVNVLDTSPALDAGDNAELPSGVTDDITGAARTQDRDGDGTATVNIGAYEESLERPPTATTDAPPTVRIRSAELTGTVNPANLETTVTFEYRKTGASSFQSVTAAESPLTGVSAQSVSASIGGLEANTEYEVKVVASNEEGTDEGTLVTFTTNPTTAPTAQTDSASSVGANTADLGGTVNPGGLETTVQAKVFPTSDPSAVQTVTDEDSPLTGDTDQGVTVSIGGLTVDTEYKARIVASNSEGSDEGRLVTFTTPSSAPPTATTEAPSSVGVTTADLVGTVNPNGAETTVTFKYRRVDTSSFQSVTAAESPLTGTAEQPVSASVSGLAPTAEYEVKVVASNAEGTDEDSLTTFTTKSVDVAVTGGGAVGLNYAFRPTPGEATQPIGVFRLTAQKAGAALAGVAVTPNSADAQGIDRVALWGSDDEFFDAGADTMVAIIDTDPTTRFPSPLSFDAGTVLPSADRYFFVTASLTEAAQGSLSGMLASEAALSLAGGGTITEVNGTSQTRFTDLPLAREATPLPVEMTSFDGTATEDGVRLRWETASEQNNAGFRVQRSAGAWERERMDGGGLRGGERHDLRSAALPVYGYGSAVRGGLGLLPLKAGRHGRDNAPDGAGDDCAQRAGATQIAGHRPEPRPAAGDRAVRRSGGRRCL